MKNPIKNLFTFFKKDTGPGILYKSPSETFIQFNTEQSTTSLRSPSFSMYAPTKSDSHLSFRSSTSSINSTDSDGHLLTTLPPPPRRSPSKEISAPLDLEKQFRHEDVQKTLQENAKEHLDFLNYLDMLERCNLPPKEKLNIDEWRALRNIYETLTWPQIVERLNSPGIQTDKSFPVLLSGLAEKFKTNPDLDKADFTRKLARDYVKKLESIHVNSNRDKKELDRASAREIMNGRVFQMNELSNYQKNIVKIANSIEEKLHAALRNTDDLYNAVMEIINDANSKGMAASEEYEKNINTKWEDLLKSYLTWESIGRPDIGTSKV